MKERLEIAGELLSLAAGALLLYRFLNPGGPEPLDIVRDAWGSLVHRIESERQYRAAMEQELQRIRDLPETEATP